MASSREEDEAQLAALAQQRDVVVTLIGPPGVGKSWLARRLASRSDGVVAALVDATTADEALAALARALGATARRQDDDPKRFADWLLDCARERALVVLDDVDGALGFVAELAQRWVEAGVRTTLVVTAREPLRIAAERRVQVMPLSPSDATTLFVNRAREVHGHEALRDADLALVPAVVERLDGLPLAIELAVSRLDAVDLHALHASLASTSGLDVLRSDFRGAAPRHASLRAAFAGSYEVLEDGPRRVLAASIWFRGGFTREDLLAVALPQLGEDARLDAFAGLRRRSLVYQTPDRRFRLLHVVRDLARERLGDTAAPFAAAHAEHFAQVALREEPSSLQDPSRGLRAERENLLAALAYARRERSELVVALVRGLHPLLSVRGPRALHFEMLTAASEAARTDADRAHVRLRRAEALLHWDGVPDAGLAALAGVAQTFRASDDLVALTRALLVECRALLGLGRFAEFEPLAAEAFATAQQTGDTSLVARTLRVQARRWLIDDGPRCRAILRDALRFVAPQSATRAELLAELARAEINAAEYAEGARHGAEALALHELLDSPLEVMIARLELAVPLWQLGELDEARRLFGLALEDTRLQRAGRLEAFVIGYVGICEAVSGDFEVALHALPLAVERCEAHGDWRHALMFRAWWAAATAKHGDREGALRIAGALREAALPVGHERATTMLLSLVDAGPATHDGPITLEVRLAEQFAASFAPAPSGFVAADASSARAPSIVAPIALPAIAAPSATMQSAPRTNAALVIHREGFFYTLPDGTRVDLDKRPVLRRVLVAIARRAAEGARASLDEVIADGWPGERVQAEAAAHRAYMAISTLRRMGLRDHLRSVGDGYELIGSVSLVDAR